MKRLSIIFTALLLAVALPMEAQAQTEIKVGPRLGIPLGDISDIGGNFSFGADARIDSEGLPVVINPAIDYYLMDDRSVGGNEVSQTLFTIDGNALYEFEVEGSFTPYAGAGIGITRFSYDVDAPNSSDTDVALNLVGGARFPLDSVEPFAQATLGVGGDYDRFGLAGGLLFSF